MEAGAGRRLPRRAGVGDLALFLRVQAAWVCQGLSRRDDPAVVRRVLAAQDRSHPSWLTLFAELRARADPRALEAAEDLYRRHGRIAGVLAGGLEWGLADETVAAAGRVLREDLVRRTEATIATLRGSGRGSDS
jgi:hypothetical protein